MKRVVITCHYLLEADGVNILLERCHNETQVDFALRVRREVKGKGYHLMIPSDREPFPAAIEGWERVDGWTGEEDVMFYVDPASGWYLKMYRMTGPAAWNTLERDNEFVWTGSPRSTVAACKKYIRGAAVRRFLQRR